MHVCVLTAISSLRFQEDIPDLANALQWRELRLLQSLEDTTPDDTSQSSPTTRAPIAPTRAYHEDTLVHIIKYLDWPSLMAMRHCPEPSPNIADSEVRARIFYELGDFIPDDAKTDFFDALHSCKGALVGQMARRVLQLNSVSVGPPTQDLAVFVPMGWGGKLYAVLSGIGYTSESSEPERDELGWIVGDTYTESFTKTATNNTQVRIRLISLTCV